MEIFNLLLSFSPFFYILYWIFTIKRVSENISYDINSGYKCYTCKKDIDSFDNRMDRAFKNNLNISELESLNVATRCKSCERDIKLNQLTKPFGFRYKLISNLDSFLISKKNYRKFILISLFTIISFSLLDIIFREVKVFFYLGQLFQLIYWLLFIRSYKLTSLKKPNQ